MSHGVDIDVRYERLSTGIRGAFLLRSADGDPHQVEIRGARLVPGDGADHPLSMEDVLVDLQPGRDLVVPFEIKPGEVPRGSYAVRAAVTVDGMPADDSVEAELRVR